MIPGESADQADDPIQFVQIDELDRCMQQIDALMQLEEAGYHIYAAMDFSEIYTFAFPLTAAIERWKQSLRKNLAKEAELQIALSYLIAGKRDILEERILILPPHLLELKDKIATLTRGIVKLRTAPSNIEQTQLQRVMRSLGGTKAVEQALGEYRSTSQISPDLMKKLFRVGTKYKEVIPLLGLISGDTSEGFTALRRLLDQGVLRDVHEVWDDLSSRLQGPYRRSKTWTDRIQEQRDDPERYYASCRDGEALAYLFVLNRVLSDSKELVLLITHSQDVLDVAGGVTIADVLVEPPSRLPFVLPPRWAAIYLAHHMGMKDETLVMLKDSREKLKAINDLEKEVAKLLVAPAKDGKQTQIELCEQRITKLQAELAQRLGRAEQLSLASQSDKFIGGLLRPVLRRRQKTVQVLEELVRLCSEPKVTERLVQEAVGSLTAIPAFWSTMLSTMSLQALGLREIAGTALSYEMFKQAIPQISKLVLGGDFQQMPYTIQFRNRRTQAAARRIVKALESGDHLEALRCLIRLLEPNSMTSEDHLLVAFFLAVVRQFEFAKEEIDRGLGLGKGPIHELLFLRANLMRIEEDYEKGISDCEKAIDSKRSWQEENLPPEERRDDPRYLNEQGYQICVKASKSLVGTKLTEKLLRGLHLFERAEKAIQHDTRLLTRVHNNILYTYTELFRLTGTQGREEMLGAKVQLMGNLRRDASIPRKPGYKHTLLWSSYVEEMAREDPRKRRLRAIARGLETVLHECDPDSRLRAVLPSSIRAVKTAIRSL